MEFKVACISSNRSANVADIEAKFSGCNWYVPADQQARYQAVSSGVVVGVEGQLPMKSLQLNAALDQTFAAGLYLVTVDDDVVKLLDKSSREQVNWMEACQVMVNSLHNSSYYLGGPYGGTNTNWSPGLVNVGRIPGALMVHKPNLLRFDNSIVGAEDLDFCIQHHQAYGGVCLYGDLCLENQWSDNEGGYQDIRNSKTLKEVTRRLHNKWAKVGCTFRLDDSKKNGVYYRVPWKKVASNASSSN